MNLSQLKPEDYQYRLVCTPSHFERAQATVENADVRIPDTQIIVFGQEGFSYARACNLALMSCDVTRPRIISGSDFCIKRLPRVLFPNRINGGWVKWMKWDYIHGNVLDKRCPSSHYIWPPDTTWQYCEEFEGTFWEDVDFIHNVVRRENTYVNDFFQAQHDPHPILTDSPEWTEKFNHNRELFIRRYKQIHAVDAVPAHILGE